MAFTSVPVTGRVQYDNGDVVASGTITFTLPRSITNSGSTRSAPFVISLLADGSIPTAGNAVYALNQRDTTPDLQEGYTVSVLVDGVSRQVCTRYVRDWERSVDLGTVIIPAPKLSARIDGLVRVTASAQSTDYTLALVDAGSVIESTASAPATFTVPPNSSVAFPVGTVVEISQYGTGQVTVAAGASVTIRTASSLKTRARYSSVCLRKRATNEWVLVGDAE